MSLNFLIIILVVLPFASWGFGSLMRTIGILSGWNPKHTFWISCSVYAIAPFLLVFMFLSSTSYITFLYVYIGMGLLSPLINITIKWLKNPDVFTKPSPKTNTNLKSAGVVKEEPVLQKPRSSRLRPRTEAIEDSIASINIKPDTNTKSGRIFVSYRRSDSADISGRIYDRLVGRFGKEPVFKDVDSIPLGVDFKEYLDKKVGECDVLLAIIGDHWLDASDSTGKARLEDPTDFVRIEIQSALERDIPVIPLLVRGALVPKEESLPSSLRKLVYRNGIPIRADPDFHRDMDRLISALEKYNILH